MFNNLTKYITHKIQKECWLPPQDTRNNNPHQPSQGVGVVDHDELTWSPERNDMSSPDIMGSNKDEIEDEHADQQVRHPISWKEGEFSKVLACLFSNLRTSQNRVP